MDNITICMYGAASPNIDPVYIEQVELLGKEIGKKNHTLIYGGGASGLMGACSRGVTSAGGKILGVIPDFMKDYEPIYDDCTRLIRTKTMSDRKNIMEAYADAFIIVPGGIGTMDEFFQVLTLKELQQKVCPIVIFNINGFYDQLLQFIDYSIDNGFVRSKVRELFSVKTTPSEVIDEVTRLLNENSSTPSADLLRDARQLC